MTEQKIMTEEKLREIQEKLYAVENGLELVAEHLHADGYDVAQQAAGVIRILAAGVDKVFMMIEDDLDPVVRARAELPPRTTPEELKRDLRRDAARAPRRRARKAQRA